MCRAKRLSAWSRSIGPIGRLWTHRTYRERVSRRRITSPAVPKSAARKKPCGRDVEKMAARLGPRIFPRAPMPKIMPDEMPAFSFCVKCASAAPPRTSAAPMAGPKSAREKRTSVPVTSMPRMKLTSATKRQPRKPLSAAFTGTGFKTSAICAAPAPSERSASASAAVRASSNRKERSVR